MIRTLFTVSAAVLCAAPAWCGEITARGSDSTMPVVKALAEAYNKATGNTVKLEGGGSSKGAEACGKGEVQLAFLSRDLKDAEKSSGLQSVPYGQDAVAVVVNKSNPLNDITTQQLHNIYTGTTTTWPDGKPVTPFNRNEDSASRELFTHVVMAKDKITDKAAIKHDGVLLSSVAKMPTAIGFTSAGEVDGSVKVLSVDGHAPTPDNVRSKAYPLSRQLFFATKGEPSADVKAFIDFCLSEPGQVVIGHTGYVPMMASVKVESKTEQANAEKAGH